MIAAVYARKSTEQNGVADEAKSIARQVEHARAYAAGKGWTVVPEHVYTDDGISGALFGAQRPGLARLLNALSPAPAFQVLVMSEESRLGREQIETAWTLKQIIDTGVRVFYYLTDDERTLDSATDKVMMALSGFASEMERERARQRTHDALLRRARAGHVANGRVFGYANQEVLVGDRRAHVSRIVQLEEADVVVRIFTMAAEGLGVKRIAATLNAEGVLAPVPRRPGRPRGWAAASVRDTLYRDLYRGRYVWNRRERRARRLRVRPEAEWVTVDIPELRIVSEEAWNAAHTRLAASRAVYLQSTGGRTYGRPVNGIASPYLLTGLAACGACGSSMFVHRHGRAAHHYYGCVVYHQRGRAVCKNNLEVRMDDTDQAVLGAIQHDLLRVEVLETSLAKALDALRPASDDERTGRLRRELAKLDAEVDRLAMAIAQGGKLAGLLGAMQERERRRAHVRTEITAIEQAGRRTDDSSARILDRLRGHLTDWQGLLRQETGPARQALTALLAGRLIFTPRERDGARYYEFEGPGTVSNVIAGLMLPKALVTR
jgi:site-specific DNA recombinase